MNKKLKILLSLVLLVLTYTNVEAQTGYRFYSINKSDGLNSNIITSVTEDGDGFIWIGTQTGLLRYDGNSLVMFNDLSDSLSLEGSSVSDLKADKNGDIWIATDHGVAKYSIKREKMLRYLVRIGEDGTPMDKYLAQKLYVTSDNKKLMFAGNGVMFLFDDEKQLFEPYAYDFFSHHTIRFSFMDNDQTLWAIDKNATTIYRVNNDGMILDSLECVSKSSFPLVETGAFLNHGDGTVWIGAYTGIYEINLASHSVTQLTELGGKPLPVSIKTFFKHQNGDIWIGTNAEELYVVNRETKSVEMIESDHSQRSTRQLNSVTVNTIFQDSNGLMWFGTWHGIAFLNPNSPIRFDALSYPENSSILTQNQISSICQAPDGTLAIGSDGGGIVFWDGKSNKNCGVYNDAVPHSTMKNSSVLAMAYDKEGNLWSGGYNNPLHKLSPDHKTGKAYSLVGRIDGITNDFIVDILFDKLNRMWVLTNGAGLLMFDPKTEKFTPITCDSRLVEPCSVYGTCLCAGPDTTILVGTYSGMYVYYPEKDIIENYTLSYGNPYSISHNVVNDITYDRNNRIWVATPAGLNKFDMLRGIFSHVGDKSALKNMICTNVVQDQTYDLWITINKGIMKFNPEVNVVSRIYDTDDGVLSNSFEKNSALMTRDGKIWIGTHDGVVSFHNVNVRTITNVPKPIITSLLIRFNQVFPEAEGSPLSQSITSTDEITLSWKDIIFSFEFTTLDFVYGKNTRFFYKLEGYNNEWTNLGTRREVGFTNLNPGRYTLRLIAENSDRVRSEECVLVINILPPWYKTKAAIAMFVLLGLFIFWLAHLLRTKGLRRRQNELEQIVKSRTSELVKLNSVLESRNEEMKQQNEEIQSQRDELFEKNNELHASRAEIQNSYQKLLDLSELDKEISGSTDIEAILLKVYNNHVVPINGCGLCICKLSQKQNVVEFSPYIQDGQSWDLPDEKLFDLIDPLTLTCFQNNQEVVADNSSDYEISPFLMEMGYRTCVRIPLCRGNEVSAVMIINSPKENAFSKNDIAIFKVIASYSEIVIEKADAYSLIKSKNVAINGSITYAKSIQELLLHQIDDFRHYFNADVIYRPKDIVSGDFLWQRVVKGEKGFMVFCAVVDCTGHGVPGAFMSLIANRLLSEVVVYKKIYEPMDILSLTSEITSSVLKQSNGENKDGMDMSLCRFDVDADGNMYQFVYSGAKCPILFRRNNSSDCLLIPANRISIAGGSRRFVDERPQFTQQIFEIVPGDTIYMYSDGIIDQSNRERTRFGRKRLVECLNNTQNLSPSMQKEKLERALDAYSAYTEQRDDITLLILQVRDKVECLNEDVAAYA